MTLIRGDASEVYKLAADLAQVGPKSVPVMRAGMQAAGEVVAKAWRNNVLRDSDGNTAIPHYPESIDAELSFSVRSVDVEVGPNKDKRQGKLGHIIEFGSETSPPHLHGLRAVTDNEARIERALGQALDPLF